MRFKERGSTNTHERVREHLEMLTDNADAMTGLTIDLVAGCKPEEEADPKRL